MKEFEDLKLDSIWDLFLSYDVCSEETLRVVTSINGYSLQTMKDILFATTGLRNLEQFINEFGISPEINPELFDDDYISEDEEY
jgi:hypothetical protein